MSVWYSEYYPAPEVKLSIKIKDVIYSEQSDYQKIEIFDTERLGRLLVLDGFVMVSELDEFVYHEMITHPALISHPDPKSVLVVGGGDGGTVREVLRHPEVNKVFLVEIDEMVTRSCQQHMPNIACEVENPKVECHFVDAVEFVKQTKEKFDIILIDSTDPISIGEGLFTTEFYQNCRNVLNENGILVAQSESAFYTPHLLPNIFKKLNSVFNHVTMFRATIPTYPSGDWYFTFASNQKVEYNSPDMARIKRLQKANELRFYNEDVHRGAFALPNFVKKLLSEQPE